MSDKLPKWLTDEQREFVDKCLEAGWEISCIVEAESEPKSSVVKHHAVFLTDDELHKIYPAPHIHWLISECNDSFLFKNNSYISRYRKVLEYE